MVEIITPRVTPSARGAGRVAPNLSSSLQRASGATGMVADSFSAFYEKEAAIQNELIVANLQSDWSERFKESAKNAGSGFTKTILGEYDAYTQEALAGAPERGRDELELAVQKYRINLEDKAKAREAAVRAAAKAKAVAETRRLKANALISDPSLLDEYLETASPEERSLYIRSALSALNEADPQAVRDQVKGGQWDADLTPDQKLSFMNASQSRIERMEAEAKTTRKAAQKEFTEDVFNEEIDYVGVTGALPADSQLTDENIDAVAGDDREWARETKRRRDVAVENAKIVNDVSTASPAEIEKIVLDARAEIEKPGRTQEDVSRLEAVTGAITKRNTEIIEDAAGYVAKHDETVATQIELMGAVDPELRPSVAANLARYLDARFDGMGVPAEFRTYMPAKMARDTVASLKGIGADVAPQALGEILSEWGGRAPAIVAQLRKAGLPPEFTAAMRHSDNPGLSAEIASLRGIKVDDLTGAIPSTLKRDIDAEVLEYTTGYTSAMLAGGGPEAVAVMNEQLDVMRRAAYRRAMESGVSEVKDLYTGMFPETVMQDGNVTAILPKGVPESIVLGAAKAALEDGPLESIVDLDIPGLPSGADRAVAIASLRSFGTWVNNSAGDGLVLMYDINGYRIPVEVKGGGYYELKFDAILNTYGRPTPADVLRSYGYDETGSGAPTYQEYMQ